MKRLADVALPAHPESFQLETKGHRLFVNVPTARGIAVIDRTRLKVIATWPVDEAQANFPMALDETSHRLFVGCRSPAKVLVYDTDTGKPVTSFPTVGDTDDLFYDPQARRLYVCGGEGFIFVYEEQGKNHFVRLAKIPTASGARTALLAPADHAALRSGAISRFARSGLTRVRSGSLRTVEQIARADHADDSGR